MGDVSRNDMQYHACEARHMHILIEKLVTLNSTHYYAHITNICANNFSKYHPALIYTIGAPIITFHMHQIFDLFIY